MSQLNPDSFGKIKVLVVGNTGSGKTSLCQFVVSGGRKQDAPSSTPGCQVHVKLLDYLEPSGGRQQYFVELWDVGAHWRYETLRRVFYKQLNGVVFVHEAGSAFKSASLSKWSAEVSKGGSFSASLTPEVAAVNTGGLPVPVLVLESKCDKLNDSGAISVWDAISARLSAASASASHHLQTLIGRRISGTDVISDADVSIGGLKTSVHQGMVDLHTIDGFFTKLIERRYYSSSAASSGGGGTSSMAAPSFWGLRFGDSFSGPSERETTTIDSPGNGRLDTIGYDEPSHDWGKRGPLPWEAGGSPVRQAGGGPHDAYGTLMSRAGSSGRLFR